MRKHAYFGTSVLSGKFGALSRDGFSSSVRRATQECPESFEVAQQSCRRKDARSSGVNFPDSTLDAVAAIVVADSLVSVRRALVALSRTPGSRWARHELFQEMLRALREHETGRHACLEEAAILTRDRIRRAGRALGRYVISRTLLVKGLEFDHVLILDGNALDRKNLYVALTRASRSLTELGTSPVLNPQ